MTVNSAARFERHYIEIIKLQSEIDNAPKTEYMVNSKEGITARRQYHAKTFDGRSHQKAI